MNEPKEPEAAETVRMNICPNCKQSHDSTACHVRPYEPLRMCYSRQEAAAKLDEWMVREFGHPLDYVTESKQQNRWYRDNGVLHRFIRELFPAENTQEVAGEALPPSFCSPRSNHQKTPE